MPADPGLSTTDREAMREARDALYPPPRDLRHVDAIDVARWDAFEHGWQAKARVLEGQQGELMTALTEKVSERGYRLVFDFMPGAGWTVGVQPENWPAARRIGAGSTFEEAALEALTSLGCSPEPEGGTDA